MLVLLGFAFLSGLVTILAPCIWPLLPIILSSSLSGKSHARPAGITLGIMLSFTVFTLSISTLVRFFHLDPNVLRWFAVVVITLLGLTLLIPKLSAVLEGWIGKLSNRFGSSQTNTGSDFGTGFITGLSLGIVWAPCAGPILATIAALAAAGQVSWYVVALTLSYVSGVGIPLFLLAYGGQRLLQQSRRLNRYTGAIQQIFGAIMILTAIALYTNYDKTLQLRIANLLPSYSSSLTQIENTPRVQSALRAINGKTTPPPATTPTTSSAAIPDIDPSLYNANAPAPELTGISRWLNTDQPLTLKELRGKVVLIDFWTYTCINCLRTLPHLTHWYDTYKNQGLVVIGVHTPEFAFEKTTQNVAQAIQRQAIRYPVAQDNDYATWNAYANQFWPAEYLIDANGNIRRTHFGEGEYEVTEQAIRGLLKQGGTIHANINQLPDQTPAGNQSPESYLGSDRAQFFYPHGNLNVGEQRYHLPSAVPLDSFSLGGDWNIAAEKATAAKDASLVYHFHGTKVFLVLRPSSAGAGSLGVSIDGKPLSPSQAGADVHRGLMTIDQDRLYNIIDLHGRNEDHLLRLDFLTPDIEVFAFTFG